MTDDQPRRERVERTDHVAPADLEEHERPPAPAAARRQGDGDDRHPEDTTERGADRDGQGR